MRPSFCPAYWRHCTPQQHQKCDHDWTTDELGKRELPAHQYPNDDAKLEHQIGRCEFERHGGDEVSTLTE
jgi:hypothetical protein